MKKAAFLFLACGVAATLVGCGGAGDTATSDPPTTGEASASSDYTLVTLSVPNMT
jgi:hypothetical protein